MNAVAKVTTYLKGTREELKKVTWPSRKEVVNYTLLVIVVSLVIAFFLGLAIDYPLNLLVQAII